ncbi:MAG: ABC transporter permease, partial [Caldisericaceae bacterium]
RTFLSALGIVVGVASLILITSFGYGAQQSIVGSINNLGSNALFIVPGKTSNVRQLMGGGNSTITKPLTYSDLEFLKSQISGIIISPASTTTRTTVKVGQNEINVTVSGVTEDFTSVFGYNLSSGRTFSTYDIKNYSNYTVLGSSIANTLFGSDNPVGQSINLLGTKFYVIGVLEKQGSVGFTNVDNNIFIPITKLIAITGKDSLTSIEVKPPSNIPKEVLSATITTLLTARHGTDNFTITDMTQYANLANTATSILTTALTIIGLIALLVGGIGIMNIMLASVAERTREIGIRKAVGASRLDILIQFVVEAMVITLVGGTIGILIGVLGAKVANALSPTAITTSSIIIGFSVSVLVGLFFGVYPAVKASKLNPVEALRYE